VNFIDEVPDGSKTWLQWEAAIDGRKSIYGVTVLQHNDAGEIVETASTSCPSRTSRGFARSCTTAWPGRPWHPTSPDRWRYAPQHRPPSDRPSKELRWKTRPPG
jgi:hypothetical protein